MDLTHDKNGEVLNPNNEEDKASYKFHNSIKESLGYHIHTEVFIIYNDIEEVVQTMYWQGGIRFGEKWKNLSIKVVDECIRMHNKSWSDWCYKNYGHYKSCSFYLKLQRALMILIMLYGLGTPSIATNASNELFSARKEIQKQNNSILSDIALQQYHQILNIIESSGFKVCKTFTKSIQTAKSDELVQMNNYHIINKMTIFFDISCSIEKPLYCFVFYQFNDKNAALKFANKMYEVKGQRKKLRIIFLFFIFA